MKRIMKNENVQILLGSILLALAVIGSCALRDWNIENQCNNGNTSMCEIMD